MSEHVNSWPEKPANVVDSVVGKTLETVAEGGRGFVLGLEREIKDGEKSITVKIEQPKIFRDEYQPPSDLRNHQINDYQSLIGFVKRYASKESSLIMAARDVVSVVINEQQERGVRECAKLPLLASEDWKAWSGIIGKAITHRQLVTVARNQEHNLVSGELLSAISSISARGNLDFNSEVTDAGESFGVTYKSAKGEQLAKFPKVIDLSLPVLELDEDTGEASKARLKLQVNMPSSPTEDVTFTLTCSLWNLAWRQRVRSLVDQIRKDLPDYTVLAGALNYRSVNLPAAPAGFELSE